MDERHEESSKQCKENGDRCFSVANIIRECNTQRGNLAQGKVNKNNSPAYNMDTEIRENNTDNHTHYKCLGDKIELKHLKHDKKVLALKIYWFVSYREAVLFQCFRQHTNVVIKYIKIILY